MLKKESVIIIKEKVLNIPRQDCRLNWYMLNILTQKVKQCGESIKSNNLHVNKSYN